MSRVLRPDNEIVLGCLVYFQSQDAGRRGLRTRRRVRMVQVTYSSWDSVLVPLEQIARTSLG